MYLVAIGWLYVALMMAVAEATNTTGTVLGAIFTFVFYGLLPVALVLYLLGTPMRRRRLREREMAERSQVTASAAGSPASSTAPDEGGETAADPLAPVRKEP